MLRVDKKNFNYVLCFGLAFLVCGVYILLTEDYSLLIVLPCIVFCMGMSYALRDFYNNIFLFSFLVCFFTFLLGGQILNRIMHVYGYDFPDKIEIHTDFVLLISLIGLLLGYMIVDNTKPKKKQAEKAINYDSNYYKNVRKISKYYFYATYFFWILTLLDIVLYVVQYGYISYYLSYASRVPAVLREIGYMAPAVLFIYLATMPKKKEAKLPIIMYSVYLLLSLGTGRRIYFMTGLLVIFAYMMLRNVIRPEEKPWISRKSIIKICITVPFLLISMYLFEYMRSENYVGTASQYSPLFGFFVRQGTSINVIKYTELFELRLNQDAYYSLYNTLRWLQDSWIDKLMNLDLSYAFGKQSQETATTGTYLADFVSYNANSNIYLDGMGYGSCYIEELYVDFGYLGVFLGNVLYGVLLCKLLKNSMRQGNIWLMAVGLFIIDAIFKAPRATFDSFFGQFLYFDSWGPFVVVFLFVKLYSRRGIRMMRTDRVNI